MFYIRLYVFPEICISETNFFKHSIHNKNHKKVGFLETILYLIKIVNIEN